MSKRTPLEGLKFNRLKVKKYLFNKQNHSIYLCVCDCGTEKQVSGRYLQDNKTKSCGCLNKENHAKRVAKMRKPFGTKISQLHHAIMQRCHDERHKSYFRYGARGIYVCKEWKRYPAFEKWCLSNGYAVGLQIDRIDNNKGYEPSNCRFVTPAQNCRNKKYHRSYKLFGGQIAIKEIHDITGMSFTLIGNKMKRVNQERAFIKLIEPVVRALVH